MPFTKRFYIERSDFTEDGSDAEFFRLTPNQAVGLVRVSHTVSFKSLEKDAEGKITKIHVSYDNAPLKEGEKAKKPKTYIQWVPISAKHSSPVRVHETRVYNQLFNSENPSGVEGGFLTDINPESEVVYKESVIEHNYHDINKGTEWVVDSIKESEFYVPEDNTTKETSRFQGMRVGYFTMDKESTDDKIILNRIVSLKDNTSK